MKAAAKPVSVFTAPTGRRYVDLADLAEICGVRAHDLDLKYRPDGWAIPRDFRWEHGRMWWAEASLQRAVDSLFAAGESDAAIRLREWLAGHLAAVMAAAAAHAHFDGGAADSAQPGHSTAKACGASNASAPAAPVDSSAPKSRLLAWEDEHQ